MSTQTPIDAAHAEMQAHPDDATARLGFYERLADAELLILLVDDPVGDKISPHIFPFDGQDYALVFDRDERLAEFADGIVPYAALSGRAIAAMLGGQNIGLGVNLGVAPSSIMIPADAVDWLVETLAHRADKVQERPVEFLPPKGISEQVLKGLDTKLALSAGLARGAYLVLARYASGHTGYLLAIIDALPNAQAAMAQSISEAMVFSGAESSRVDVAFFDGSDPICTPLARAGLRFDFPEPELPVQPSPAPGMDPDNPPKLR